MTPTYPHRVCLTLPVPSCDYPCGCWLQSDTALAELGIRPNRGERIVLNIDFVGMLSSLGAGLGGGVDLDDPAAVRGALEAAGLDFSAGVDVDVGGLGQTLADLLGLGGLDLSGVGTATVDPSAAFDALYPALRSSLVLNQVVAATWVAAVHTCALGLTLWVHCVIV